ncbi:hypothetical protein ENBRE01_1178 [Enteropsectra breve]|nr:hypothetical protein ENBRE01_1178 [Enteropsectra breve]
MNIIMLYGIAAFMRLRILYLLGNTLDEEPEDVLVTIHRQEEVDYVKKPFNRVETTAKNNNIDTGEIVRYKFFIRLAFVGTYCNGYHRVFLGGFSIDCLLSPPAGELNSKDY